MQLINPFMSEVTAFAYIVRVVRMHSHGTRLIASLRAAANASGAGAASPTEPTALIDHANEAVAELDGVTTDAVALVRHIDEGLLRILGGVLSAGSVFFVLSYPPLTPRLPALSQVSRLLLLCARWTTGGLAAAFALQCARSVLCLGALGFLKWRVHQLRVHVRAAQHELMGVQISTIQARTAALSVTMAVASSADPGDTQLRMRSMGRECVRT